MNQVETAETVYPGCLYAKSFLADEQTGAEFQWYFLHQDLKPFVPEIDALRTSFFWESGDNRNHVPVVIVETATSNSSLVVRFSDSGKDKFGRDGTIRLEAFLVPNTDVSALIDGAFVAIPQKDKEAFLVRPSESRRERLPQGSVGVFGRPGTFKLKSFGIESRDKCPKKVLTDREDNVGLTSRRKIRRAYIVTSIFCLIAVITIIEAIRLVGAPDKSKEELRETRRKVMELETGLVNVKEDMAAQKKSFDDFILKLKDLVNKAP